MTILTKGRYALRIMIDLAENSDGSYIPMKKVAQRQDLPIKYLEHILPVFTQNHLIEDLVSDGENKTSGIDLSFLDAAL